MVKIKQTGVLSPYKRAGIAVVGFLVVVLLTVDFGPMYLKSWMFELMNPTHSVELNVSRVK